MARAALAFVFLVPGGLFCFAGFDAEQGIGRAVSHQCCCQRYNANPAPGRLRANKDQGQQDNTHDGTNNTISGTHVYRHLGLSCVMSDDGLTIGLLLAGFSDKVTQADDFRYKAMRNGQAQYSRHTT
ncbi:hypothetical protein; putative exported protein [Marinobacter nauticus ATCC 49840]|nr:hypothetical protein; putative exported protein [Marinobacter nauticus ATCC 49840]